MVFIKIVTLIFATTPILVNAGTKPKLPELITKQNILDLRFLSQDGKFLYFQKRSGSLVLSTNFSVKEIIEGKRGDQYLIKSSPARKNIIIERKSIEHSHNSLLKPSEIFWSPLGSEKKATYLDVGINPKLHLDDSWISFFDLDKRVIHFKYLFPPYTNHIVKIKNSISPYFTPHAIMLDDKRFLFTDINKQGNQQITLWDRQQKSKKILYVGSNPGKRIEICSHQDNLYIGDFGSFTKPQESSIHLLKTYKLPAINSKELLYSSKKNDLGKMICNFSKKEVLFIKNTSPKKTLLDSHFNIFSLDTEKRSVAQLTKENYYHSIINMDGRILTPHHGKYYILKGQVFNADDSLKP